MPMHPTNSGSVPIPDPTALTTEQLRRELQSLREIMEARLNAVDKATILFQENLTRVPTDTDKQISHLKELHDEKFNGIEKQFRERDVRTDQSSIATKIAGDAALSAQKEAAAAQNEANAAAITKSEAATVKQIDGILALLASNTKAIDEKITSINGRLDRGEGGNAGMRQAESDNHVTMASVIGIVGGVVGVITLMAMLAFGVINTNHQSAPPTVVSPAVVPLH